MKRKIYQSLVDWKTKDAGQSALPIDGARRVGKSYIAEEFGPLINLKWHRETIQSMLGCYELINTGKIAKVGAVK